MMVLLDRKRRAGPYLEWKVRIFAVAAVVALAGIYLDERWLTGAAIGILMAGLSLRFLPAGRGARDEDHAEGSD